MASNGRRPFVYAGAAQWTKETPKALQTGLFRSAGDDPDASITTPETKR